MGDLALDNTQVQDLLAERLHPSLGITNVIELGLHYAILDVFPGLHNSPDSPHRMRRWAPHAHLIVECCDELVEVRWLEDGIISALDEHVGMLDVRGVKVASLGESGVAGCVEEVRSGSVVVRGPFVEVVGDVERCWVGTCILKVDDDDLERRGFTNSVSVQG